MQFDSEYRQLLKNHQDRIQDIRVKYERKIASAIICAACFILGVVILVFCAITEAGANSQYTPRAKFSESQIIRCIVGEEAQRYEGMVAVGEAIRNRAKIRKDPLDGVYGCNAKHLDLYPKDHWIWKKGREAWEASAYSTLVKGADHWHSDLEKRVWWEKYGTLTVKIGNHKFYKEVYK